MCDKLFHSFYAERNSVPNNLRMLPVIFWVVGSAVVGLTVVRYFDFWDNGGSRNRISSSGVIVFEGNDLPESISKLLPGEEYRKTRIRSMRNLEFYSTLDFTNTNSPSFDKVLEDWLSGKLEETFVLSADGSRKANLTPRSIHDLSRSWANALMYMSETDSSRYISQLNKATTVRPFAPEELEDSDLKAAVDHATNGSLGTWDLQTLGAMSDRYKEPLPKSRLVRAVSLDRNGSFLTINAVRRNDSLRDFFVESLSSQQGETFATSLAHAEYVVTSSNGKSLEQAHKDVDSLLLATLAVVVQVEDGDAYPVVLRSYFDPSTGHWYLYQVTRRSSVRLAGERSLVF